MDRKERLSALVGLFDAGSEAAGWRRAGQLGVQQFDVDAFIGLELLGESAATIRHAVGLGDSTPRAGFPVAPDSQLDFVRRSDDVVISDDIVSDGRFVASSMLDRAGMRSSMSWRFELAPGHIGALGVHSRRAGAFCPSDVAAFGEFITLAGTALAQLRERDRLLHAARFDPLTGVLNRGAVMHSLAARLGAGGEVCALLIDLDGFKSVNDDHGHAIGDVALDALARRMERCLGPDDSLGRLGGDEFLAITTNLADAQAVAERIISHVEEAMLVGRSLVQLSASVGIATRGAGDDADSMIERADRLMYRAKSGGRGRTLADDNATRPRLQIAPSKLRTSRVQRCAVDEAIGGLRVAYQPIVEADSGLVYGYEALARGPIGHDLEFPDALFGAATTHGRLGELEVAAKALALDEAPVADVPLFVNLEPELLCDSTWGPKLLDAITLHADGRRIVAEVTERAVLQSPGRLLRSVEACRDRGWSVALDDVGSRSDSLAVLRCLRPDVVKLDMGLIDVDRFAHAANVSASVSAYREAHDALVVAEGVEDEAQLEQARVLGADLIQGYLFGRPAPGSAWASTPVARQDVMPIRARRSEVREGSKLDMLHLSRHVESVVLSPDCMLLASVQDAEYFTERTRRQYSAIARRCGMVGVVGTGLTERWGRSFNGVRVADLDPDDELAAQWNVIVLSPSKSVALLAHEVVSRRALTAAAPTMDMDRRFAFRLVTDGAAVEAAASAILRYF